MFAGTPQIALAATVALVALGPALALLVNSLAPAAAPGPDSAPGPFRPTALDLAREHLAVTLIGWAVWIAAVLLFDPPVEPALVLPMGGLAGVAAVLVAILMRSSGVRLPSIVAFVPLWSALVFVPVAIAVFSVTDGLLGAGLRTLDLGGSLPVAIAAGAAGIPVVIAARAWAPAGPRPTVRSGPVVASFALVWALWTAWLVGLELAVDELTAQIVLNAVVGPVMAMLAWLIVQRALHARTTAAAAVAGLLSGLVAVTAGCAYLNTVGAAITGVAAGAACSLAGYAAVRRAVRPAVLLSIVLLLGGGIGVVLLGVLATRAGLMFTGQPEVLFAQTASVAAVALYSGLLSSVLWWTVRKAARLRPQAHPVG